MELSKGVTIEKLTDDASLKFKSQQKSFTEFVRLQPYNQVYPVSFLKYEKRLKEFEVKDDDVYIASFPKCGTTWTEEMVWLIMNNLDYEGSSKTLLDERVPFIEMSGLYDLHPLPEGMDEVADWIDVAKKMNSPRIIKTHLSIDMLPQGIMEKKKAKVVYVTRNPRDACVSYYNHWRIFEGYSGTLEDFCDAFLNDAAGYYCPFFVNILGYWNSRHEPNICFITYEEMKADLASVIRKVSSFLDKPVPEEKMDELVKHLSFDQMKKNPAVNKAECVDHFVKAFNISDAKDAAFMNKGKSGNWKTKLSPELIKRFETWEEKWLQGSDLKLRYD